MADNERLRFGIEGEPHHRRPYFDVPPAIFGRLAVKEAASEAMDRLTATQSPILEVEKQPTVRGIWRFVFAMNNLRRHDRLHDVVTDLGQVLTDLDSVTEPAEKDPRIKVIMRGGCVESEDGYQMRARIAWPQGWPDAGLSDAAYDVARSGATDLLSRPMEVRVSRLHGVSLTVLDSPEEAEIRTERYRPPSSLPASHLFTVRSVALKSPKVSVLSLGVLFAIAHPEDVKTRR